MLVEYSMIIKKFNTTGICVPEKHFMANTSVKIQRIKKMVEEGEYFNINRPRQYGKTTTLYLLTRKIREEGNLLALKLSFEGIDTETHKKQALFIKTFLEMMKEQFLHLEEKQMAVLTDKYIPNTQTMTKLSGAITHLMKTSERPVVMMIDEVDKSSNNQLFLDFLGMLRLKYQNSREGHDSTFHSVILAGVHDVKTLKTKIRGGQQASMNSPWNIAIDFDVDLSLSINEIMSMLEQYQRELGVKLDKKYFARKLYYYTSGHPFLVSHLCKLIDEKILPEKSIECWTPMDLENAVKMLLALNNTNFDGLIKNLENDKKLYEFVFDIILNNKVFSFNIDNPTIHYASIYGILKDENEKPKIHNRLYEQRIYNYMTSKLETSGKVKFTGISDSYDGADGSLDLDMVLVDFQKFITEQYSRKDIKFLERYGRLLFLAFIKPIIHGKGFDFKEVQISEEKRLDVVITFNKYKYIIELKIWRGYEYHKKSISQLFEYLVRQNQERGWLLIFDQRKKSGRVGQTSQIKEDGKTIFAVWL